MEDVPERREAAETLGRDWIKKVVHGDDDQAEGSENLGRQVHQRGENDHAQTQHPENSEDEGRAGPVPLKEKDEAEEGEFEKHEPESAGEKEARELLKRAAAVIPEKRADAGGEGEDWRAEVGDPARKEKRRSGPGEVSGRERHGRDAGEV